MHDYYKPGSINGVCKVCGFKHKVEDLKLRWDGVMVCPLDLEERHPSDHIRVPNEPRPVEVRGGKPADPVYITFYLLTEAGEVIDTEASERLEWR